MSTAFDAFHLPVPPATAFRTLQAGRLTCRYPEPETTLLAETAQRLQAAGARLAERSLDDVIGAIDGAAARLADAADPLRIEAERRIPGATGYSLPMVRLVLDRMTADWRGEALRRLLRLELGGPDALHRFIDRGPDTRSAAVGPRLAFHVFSGNVPGVAVTSLVRALLVRAPSFGKLAAGEPVLPVLFARALAAVDPTIADAIALSYWPGGEEGPEHVLLDAADTVIVYGGEEAAVSLRARARPGQRVLVHGPRLSLAAIGNGPLEDGLAGAARRAARAVATFDQQGCVSPHSIWVEGPDHRAAEAARLIAAELENLRDELPRGALSPAEASAIQQERGAAEMRAHHDPRVQVWTGPGTEWTVVLEPASRVRPSCLNRFIRVHPIDDLERLPPLLAPLHDRLQAIALEGTQGRDDALALALARAGATRITTLERLPWPPPYAHHDGSPPLRELLRWTDRER